MPDTGTRFLVPVVPRCSEAVAERKADERTWNLAETHDGNSDISRRSTITLRSDGTGHMSLLIDNDDTWEISFRAMRANGEFLFHLPGVYGDGDRFHCDNHHREIDFTWHIPEVLDAIGILLQYTSH